RPESAGRAREPGRTHYPVLDAEAKRGIRVWGLGEADCRHPLSFHVAPQLPIVPQPFDARGEGVTPVALKERGSVHFLGRATGVDVADFWTRECHVADARASERAEAHALPMKAGVQRDRQEQGVVILGVRDSEVLPEAVLVELHGAEADSK